MFSLVVCRFGQGPRFRTSGPRLREVFGTREITTMASGCTCCVYTERPSVVHTVAGVYFRSMRCERGRVRGRRCVSVGARARARARARDGAVAQARGPAGPRVRTETAPRPHRNTTKTAPNPHRARTDTAPRPHRNRTETTRSEEPTSEPQSLKRNS